jgi:hypothetical protein
MKTTLQRNLFIALISLGLLSSVRAAQPVKYNIKDVLTMFTGMINKGTETVEDAIDKLKEKGAIDFANLVMGLADKLWDIVEAKGIDPDKELTDALSKELGDALGAKTFAVTFMTCHAKEKLKMLGELFFIEAALKKIPDVVLHQSLLRRRNKKRIGTTTTITQVHIDESLNYNNQAGNHDVRIEGDLTITDTTTPTTGVVATGRVKNRR